MKNKKVTVLTICVVFLLIALIGVSVFCIHLMNKENNETKEVVSSGEDTETDNLASKEPSSETTDNTAPETTPEPTLEPTPAPTPEPLALHMVQAELQRKYHNDELTATLLEKEYFYEVSESQTDSAFEVNLVGFTGDALTPMILLDVTVNDETLLSEDDKIFMEVYCLGTYEYENKRDSYSTFEAYGIKDSENSRLFHVSMPGPATWITYGKEFVIDIFNLSIGSSEQKDYSWDEYDVNMEYRVTVPQSTFKPVISHGYEGTVFEKDGLIYDIDIITPSYYYTELRIFCDYSNTELANVEQKGDLRDALKKASDDFVKDLVLTINGKDYKGNSESSSAISIQENGAYFYTDFPGMDSKLIYSMTISHGETSYKLE